MPKKLLQISVNENLIDKIPPAETSAFKYGFEPVNVTIGDLEELVGAGICFSYQFKDGVRNTNNFLRADFLAVDMDGGRTITECLDDPIVKEFGSLFYTTPRHAPDHHRFRLVFTLPRTIIDVHSLRCAAVGLSRRLGGDLTATDGARIFYGSSECQSKLLGKSISDDFLNELIVDGNDNPVSDSTAKKRKTTTISKRPIDPTQPIIKADGVEVLFKDISTKTKVYCPYHADKNPHATVSFSKNSGTRYLSCEKCNLLWWEKNSRFARFDFSGFEKAVKRIKSGDIKKDADDLTPLEMFSDLGMLSSKNIHVSNDEFLQLSKIDDGLTIIRSPKGTGKTTYLASALQKVIEKYSSFEAFEEAAFSDPNARSSNKDRILLIGHRQALIGDLCKRLHLNSYLDDSEFRPQEIKHRQSRYGLCLDSLWKVKDEKYDIIVIDEVEQVLGHFLSETIGSRRESTFRIFSMLLQKAKKIVVLDADISWITFNTLYAVITDSEVELSPEIGDRPSKKKTLPVQIYINEWQPADRNINVFPSDFQLIQHIKTSILEGKRIFIASNSKRKIKTLEKMTSEFAKRIDIDIPFIAITSENSGSRDTQKFIKNIKEEILDYKVIMSSPSLGTGIDITFDNKRQEIDVVYGLFENRINTHFEIDQQLARVRHPKEVNVWISPARYNFATDIAVVTDDCLRSDLVSSVEDGFAYGTKFEQSGIPPFLKMAALIVTTQRASKNDLKNNFKNYKRLQNWSVKEVPEDENLKNKGKALYKSMLNLSEQEAIENICSARTLNEFDYEKFLERIEQFNESAEPEDWYRFFKTRIELFYGMRADSSIIAHERKHYYRQKVRRFESIQRKPDLKKEERENLISKKSRNLARIYLELEYDYHSGSSLLYQLLSTTPIFSKGEFDPSVVISTHDLKEFGENSAKFRKFTQTQLEVATRTDVVRKPIQHLGNLLKVIGLELEGCDVKKTGKVKTYYYKLSASDLSLMLEITKRRAIYDPLSKNIGWTYVNKLHGFEYSEEEMDWLYRR